MSGMKSLAKDTALYGLSSIIGKLLNWLLVPLYVVKVNDFEFGEVTQLYAWTGLLQVMLTYGLETGFFRFANKDEDTDPGQVYSTCLISIWSSTVLFLILMFSFLTPVTGFLGYPGNEKYILMMTTVVGMDVLTSLPFAYLRYQKRPLKFASIKLLSVFVNIALNLFFFVLCPMIYKDDSSLVSLFYSPETSGVFYILLSNVFSSAIMLIALYKELFMVKYSFNKQLLKELLRYSFPLLILGVAGIINQTADKILLPWLDPVNGKAQLGIYGANFKFAVIMVMFIQAFRFAYEPFVFGKFKNQDNNKSYIEAMKYFIILGLFIFLSVGMLIMLLPEIPFVANHVQAGYFSGLRVVPIVMLAEFFFGIFFNLSFWYKLTDKTQWGAYFSTAGCVLTILMNVALIPRIGYMACAWTSITVYFLMMVVSYVMGQKYYPIKYELKNAAFYLVLTAILYSIGMYAPIDNVLMQFMLRIVLIMIYLCVVIKKDLPLSEIPFINKLVKR